jgi:hypothetical protein
MGAQTFYGKGPHALLWAGFVCRTWKNKNKWYTLLYIIGYDIFVNGNWVATRWQ